VPNANNVEVICTGVVTRTAGKIPAVAIANDKEYRPGRVQDVAADDDAEVVR
jgi:hypothetical protein